MRQKITLLSTLIALCFSVKAQQIPNGGFETWSSINHPDNFGSYESAAGYSGNIFTFKDTNDKFEGNASVKLVTDTITIPGTSSVATLPGAIGFGTSTLTTTGVAFSPTVFAYRPDTIFFAYKYTSPGADKPGIILKGYSGGQEIISGMIQLSVTDTNWRKFALLINYGSFAGDLDHLLIIFQSSTTTPVVGSALHVDAMRIGYNPFSGINDVKKQIGLKVYPNPASDILNVTANKNLEGCNIQMYSLSGELISSKVLEGTENTFDLDELLCGTYIYRITDGKNNLIDQIKISVLK